MSYKLGDVEQEDYDLEAVYDAEIFPLVKLIHTKCLELNIPMFACFAIGRNGAEEHTARTAALNITDNRRSMKLSSVEAVYADDNNMHSKVIRGDSDLGQVLKVLLGLEERADEGTVH